MSDVAMKGMEMQQGQAQKNFENQLALMKAGPEADLNKAKATFYGNGGPSMNRVVSAVDPATGKTVYTTAKDAMSGGFSPIAGYNNTAVTLSPEAIKQQADSIATTGKIPQGLGIGMNGNKKAILNQLASDHPNVNLGNIQAQFAGETSAARTVGSTAGRIEFASESLGSMIPLAKQASAEVDRTQYPTINAIQNAVEKGTGDTKIIALNTYLNAVIGDQAQLIARSGVSTDAAREAARASANAAFTSGQLNQYFDAVENEIKAQRAAGKSAMGNVTSMGSSAPQAASGSPQQPVQGGKVVSQSDLATMAAKRGISLDQAKQAAAAKGYTVQ
jgi:hypothetical protein